MSHTPVAGGRCAVPGIQQVRLSHDITTYEILCEGVDPMGRGRAKAKQTKVARDLKYRTIETDFEQLQRELHGESGRRSDHEPDEDEADYAEYGEGNSRR